MRKRENKIRDKLEKYFKEGKRLYYEKLKLIDSNVLKRMRKQPLLPKDITKYLYLKGFLTDTEFNIYYYLFIGKEHLNLGEMASLLNIPTEKVKEAISNINKIRNNMDKEEFESYHEDLIIRLGFDIYNFAIYGAIPPKEGYQNKFKFLKEKQ